MTLHRSILLVVLALCVASCATATRETGAGVKRPRSPDDYRPRTLAELVALAADSSSLGDKLERMRVDGDVHPSLVHGTCDGMIRAIPAFKAEVIRQWARLYAGSMEHYTIPYATEMMFEDASGGHWIAVRWSDLDGLKESCRARRALDLRVVRLGAALVGDRWEPLLLLESAAN